MLAHSGYDVDTAADGREAWAALHDVSYQLLIAEHDLPRITGLELVSRARRVGMAIPVILASDAASLIYPEAVTWLGLAAYLRKPCALDQLLNAVGQLLATARNFCQRGSMQGLRIGNGMHPISIFSHGGLNE